MLDERKKLFVEKTKIELNTLEFMLQCFTKKGSPFYITTDFSFIAQ